MGKSWAVDDRQQLSTSANKELDKQLAPGELVRVIVRGIQSTAIIGTDRRASVFKKTLFEVRLNSWDYAAISGVEFADKGPMMPGFVRLRSVGTESSKMAHMSDSALQINFNEKGDASNASAVLRRLIGEYQAPSQQPAPVVADLDIADQIRKLAALRDDGIISVDEFESRKRRLLES